MSQLYVKCFGFTSASREAKSLTTQKGFNSTTTTADYADVVFNVIKDRCPGKCTVSVFEMNEYLDKIADSATTTLGEYLILHSDPPPSLEWLFNDSTSPSRDRNNLLKDNQINDRTGPTMARTNHPEEVTAGNS